MSPLKRLQHAKDFISAWHGPLTRYERHISAAAMVAGFGIDNYTFGRIDRPAANIIFTAYLALAAATIALLHYLQSRADKKYERAMSDNRGRPAPAGLATPAVAVTGRTAHAGAATVEGAQAYRESAANGENEQGWKLGRRLHGAVPAVTQFALGGLLSGFLVFYSRSAVFAASWPFLIFLAAVFIGNEVFRQYRQRLVFTALLFFFLLYSYAIFAVPVLLGQIGSFTFGLSGVLAIALFIVFLRVLRRLGRDRFRQTRLGLYGGAIAILSVMNLFYFTDILPPLPLALSNVGIYHAVKRTGAVYTATTEPEETGWTSTITNMFTRPVLHLTAGEPMALYAAVFAPIKLTTHITHRWRWFDPVKQRWITLSSVTYAISGGREGGYRGYTIKTRPKPGSWRVDIKTEDGRLLGRVPFEVDAVPAPVTTVQKTIP